MSAHDAIAQLSEQMGRSIIGQGTVIERIVIGLLANGNLLVEGLPGLANTRAIKALATNLEADFSRIQFTPDLLPADVTGTEVYYAAGGIGAGGADGEKTSAADAFSQLKRELRLARSGYFRWQRSQSVQRSLPPLNPPSPQR